MKIIYNLFQFIIAEMLLVCFEDVNQVERSDLNWNGMNQLAVPGYDIVVPTKKTSMCKMTV